MISYSNTVGRILKHHTKNVLDYVVKNEKKMYQSTAYVFSAIKLPNRKTPSPVQDDTNHIGI